MSSTPFEATPTLTEQLGPAWLRLQADLPGCYLQALQAGMFANRSELRPAMLGRIATAEAESVLQNFETPNRAAAEARGVALCQTGLSVHSVLLLSQASRQLLIARLDSRQLVSILDAHDAYHSALIQGFIQTREKVILSEQERIRSALQRTLNRYTVQMELAAGVAAATTSILEPAGLFIAAVSLIQERFDLYYAAIFLVDEQRRWAVLRAGSGQAGQTMLQAGYRLELGSDSLISQCLATGETISTLGLAGRGPRVEHPYLPDTQSEAAIPLIVRHQMIGAISVHSQRVAGFTDQDITVLVILANQLANAIENARLFAELRQSEERYRTVLENIEEGYYETDLDGFVTFVNDSTTAILGFSRAEIESKPYWSFGAPEQGGLLAETFKTVRRTGEAAKNIEFEILLEDETSRFVETSVTLLRDPAGQPAGFRGVIRDTTRRKLAEQLLVERKALERSNRELEQFAYVASHDLQEPLRKIKTFGDRLKAKYAPVLGDEGRDYLARMLNATERMENLINDLLVLSRVATKSEPFSSVNLAQVAREVITDLETRLEATGGQVTVHEMAILEADPLQMRQLFQNLIGNALKFHRPGVPPRIQVYGRPARDRRQTGTVGSSGGWYQLVVEDNGIGFASRHADRIFQPFQRLHGRDTYEGTGIGLTICQRIAERHGGRIAAHSTQGEGATFVVTLPLRDGWNGGSL